MRANAVNLIVQREQPAVGALTEGKTGLDCLAAMTAIRASDRVLRNKVCDRLGSRRQAVIHDRPLLQRFQTRMRGLHAD